MEIKREAIKVKDLCDGYVNDEMDIEKGVYAYSGKLCVRPAFQRSFIYGKKEENAVIDTALKGFPLNIMYWVDNGDGTYDCLDGQQRTISLCNFVDGVSSYNSPWLNGNKKTYFHTLKRVNPDLAEKFLNYELEVYICKGTKAEQLEWFRTINIAGQALTSQELRNANYVSSWLTDAKRYFSRTSTSNKCPAERLGGQYTKENANRQELLEQVITWRIGSNKDEDICQYMEDHINDKDASDLWNYFNNVIEWIKEIFPGTYDDGMASVKWGYLYNNYHNEKFNPDEIAEELEHLIEFKASNELTATMAKIIEYCITHDEKLLSHREFSPAQKTALYTRQKGICPDCGKHYLKTAMHAHHIIPWCNGGLTDMSNGVMLCKECHTLRHANS